MDGGKKSRNPHKASADYRSDRKSASGMSGDPKKGGRGGKFTWEGADDYGYGYADDYGYGYADEDLGLISKKGNSNSGRSSQAQGGGAAKKDDDE
uniref:Uncharacterized protein n=1 Tax=Zea mays TaxID=4577 RepID=B6U1N7_MAIZE|nr:hypothetical protein [Zea mays]